MTYKVALFIYQAAAGIYLSGVVILLRPSASMQAHYTVQYYSILVLQCMCNVWKQMSNKGHECLYTSLTTKDKKSGQANLQVVDVCFPLAHAFQNAERSMCAINQSFVQDMRVQASHKFLLSSSLTSCADQWDAYVSRLKLEPYADGQIGSANAVAGRQWQQPHRHECSGEVHSVSDGHQPQKSDCQLHRHMGQLSHR